MGNHKKENNISDYMIKFQLQSTDGPGQTGILTIRDKKVAIPTILFPASSRYVPPSYAECFISSTKTSKKKEKNPCLFLNHSIFFQNDSHTNDYTLSNYLIIPEALPKNIQTYLHQLDQQDCKDIVILPADEHLSQRIISTCSPVIAIVSNASHLFSNEKKFVSYITHLRNQSDYDTLLFLPSIATPSNLSFLIYAGCDLFDATSAILAARHHQFFLPDTSITHVDDMSTNPCICPICFQTKKQPSSFSFTELVQHNYHMLWQELILIRNSMQNNQLRDLVEQRIRTSPHLVTLLRYLDTLGFDYVEQRTPVCYTEKYKLFTTSREAGFRPEIKRFQRRILHRYKKPEAKKILVLLPCSAKKPYSFSKSHQRFHQSLSKIPSRSVIHELIVTSPLGLVPRELELTYPASSYDISVTGSWYEDEKHMIQQQLNQFLKRNTYDYIVSHIPESVIHSPENLENKWYYSLSDGKTTSQDSLKKLHNVMYNIMSDNEYEHISKANQRLIQFHAIAAYQFGFSLANMLTKDCTVKGKYPYLKLFNQHNTQLGMIPDLRGLISLTAEGGKRMISAQEYIVCIDTGFTVKGSILAPGVLTADEKIRKGDDVLVFQGKKFLGVGSSMMNGDEMMKRDYGEAVNMRHKIKKQE